ncbi:MAG: ABC transporter ATP-binding protein [Pseudomonadota bacterium]
MGLLTASGVVSGYSPGDMILKGVGLDVEPGEIVCIIGPNGAGKSTLMKTIAGLLSPSEGRIAMEGQSIVGLRARDIARRGIAFVPQEANVFASMSVRENLEIGGYINEGPNKPRIEAMLERFPMLAEKRRVAARTLSGGQRQVLAMAIAMMVEPRLLMLDEPSAGLSPAAAEKLFESIQQIRDSGVAIVMVEQNALQALQLSDRAFILVDGKNNRTGPAADLAADPDVRRAFLGL